MKNIITTALLGTLLGASMANADELKDKSVKIKQAAASHVRPSLKDGEFSPNNVVDGKIADDSRWVGKTNDAGELWLELTLQSKQQISGLHLHTGYQTTAPLEDFYFEFKNDADQWTQIPSAVFTGNKATSVRVMFDSTVDVVTDSLRLVVTKSLDNKARVKEITLFPYNGKAVPPLSPAHGGKVPLIYLNQSGFNLDKPKRFTAPTLTNGTVFSVVNSRTGKTEFKGEIKNHLGDFSSFNPITTDEYTVQAGGEESFPFSIGHWLIEKATYDAAVRFMAESRHYFGNHKKKARGSFGWRDDHHFNWVLTTLAPQYLSNPVAYERMPKLISYEQKDGFNGALEPYEEAAPDVVKMMHFFADVVLTQGLKHELMKEQLAYFLYSWPWIKQYMPQQNFDAVADYAFQVWTDPNKDRGYPYDSTPKTGHNLLELKTKVGSTKGENPPGHSVQPNLMMYEVAKRLGRSDANLYFDAAYKQVEWMIANLDWNDPQTTKGQRMSEHVTMTGLAMFLSEYPDRAPKGLSQKIKNWKQVVLSRSDNMWDFRKLSDVQWTPTGDKPTHWNEPGNVLGFPAIALAAIDASPDSQYNPRLEQLVYAHLDNVFGRNPAGRHFSYDGPREIEGVDLGWYSFYRGGIGQLADTYFVFDGAPKTQHYPYNPEVGNIGWTEGWIQFNTAYNISLAYMANHDIKLEVDKTSGSVRLKAPLNFDYDKVEIATIQVVNKGEVQELTLTEDANSSAWFSAKNIDLSDVSEVSYGFGYLKHKLKLN